MCKTFLNSDHRIPSKCRPKYMWGKISNPHISPKWGAIDNIPTLFSSGYLGASYAVISWGITPPKGVKSKIPPNFGYQLWTNFFRVTQVRFYLIPRIDRARVDLAMCRKNRKSFRRNSVKIEAKVRLGAKIQTPISPPNGRRLPPTQVCFFQGP